MTLSANAAYQMSVNSQNIANVDDVNQELGLVEARIAAATTFGNFVILYNASIVNNPPSDPNVDAALTPNQLLFRNTLQEAGYVIGVDGPSGFWSINWQQTGPEDNVTVYEIRTTVVPGSVQVQTTAALANYYAGLTPIATDRTLIAASAISGTYVHLSLVDQQDTANLSAGILAALIAAGLGYSGGNTSVAQRT